MGWTLALFGRLTKSATSSSSSTSNTPVFEVNRTQLVLTADAPELTLREVNKATRSFSAARLVGRGENSTVYRAVLPSGTAAAAKRLGPPPSGAWSAANDAFLRQQVSALSMHRHENLVRLLGYTITADLRVLLFELATVGTLHDVLHGPRGEPQPPGSGNMPAALTLSWAQRTRIALDAARGLQYLHEAAAVSHWGISSAKVLLFEGLRAKIADYDVFKQLLPDGPTTGDVRVRTPTYDISTTCSYLPPECLMTGRWMSRKSDVYCFGVVLLELLTGRKSWDETLDRSQCRLVNWATPMLRKGRIEGCIDPRLGTQYPPGRAAKLGRIAVQCLHHDPRSRPSMGIVARLIGVVGGYDSD